MKCNNGPLQVTHARRRGLQDAIAAAANRTAGAIEGFAGDPPSFVKLLTLPYTFSNFDRTDTCAHY